MKFLTVARPSFRSRCIARLVLASALTPTFAVVCSVFSPGIVFAQSEDAIAKVKDLNQKALAAYENLELEEARKALLEALQICAQEGMNDHPWKARTHIHLGAILAGGFQQKDLALKQFQRALEIQPEIQLTPSLRNPETTAAFEEAKKAGGAKQAPAAETKPAEPKPIEKPVVTEKPATESATSNEPSGISHQPVANAAAGTKVEIKAKVTRLKFSRVVLAYRPEGATGFLARDMEASGDGWYSARIPEPATQGGLVQYYIEARDETGRAVANNGSETEPHVVSLGDAGAGVDDASLVEADPVPASEETSAPSEDKVGFVFGLSLGSGLGYASGTPEVNPKERGEPGVPEEKIPGINFSGVAPSKLGHINIEGGYAIRPGFILSLQVRLQKVSGGTEGFSPAVDENNKPIIKKFSPATGAVAAFAKATWLLGAPGTVRPYVSALGGYGEIRHVVDIGDKRSDCGPLPDPTDPSIMATQRCIDTLNSGPFFVGGSAGAIIKLGESLGLTAGVNGMLGVSRVTLHADLNVGLLMLL
jgi:hypothetical protein